MSRFADALRASGPYVQLEAAEWLPEVACRDTPESILDAKRDAESRMARDRLEAYMHAIPEREALGLALRDGLFDFEPHELRMVAQYLAARSKQAASYSVGRARQRLRYLMTRPPLDFGVLSRVLSEPQLETVRAVYTQVSFTDVADRRWPCPADKTPEQRRTWRRNKAQRIKRAFMFATAKVERAGLASQVEAMRDLLRHQGVLSYHEGKGRRP